jgi:S-adenosylmethionine:tRNA ribosyltransferase-isomerase
LASLATRGVRIASVTLHTGVSSLEVENARVEDHPIFAEPFSVPASTATMVNRTHIAGGRVVAVGTTTVRALESAWDGARVRSLSGFTRLLIHPERGVRVVDGLISGFHDPLASHLALLYAVAGRKRIADAYGEAMGRGYLWHEFGDSHFIWADRNQ